MIKDCFPFCASSPGTRRLEKHSGSNRFKAGLCFYFCSGVAALQSLVAAAYGVNRPPRAAWGVKQTIPISRGNMINISVQFTWSWFSVDKAAGTLPPSGCRAHLPRTVWWGSGRVPCHPDRVFICCRPPHSHGQIAQLIDCTMHASFLANHTS